MRLRQNPRLCPNCGGKKIARIDRGADVVGKRRCKRCGCFWEPPWSRFTVWASMVVYAFLICMGGFLTYLKVPDYLSGEAFRLLGSSETFEEGAKSFMGPIMIAFMSWVMREPIAVARGKKGQGRVLEMGVPSDADED